MVAPLLFRGMTSVNMATLTTANADAPIPMIDLAMTTNQKLGANEPIIHPMQMIRRPITNSFFFPMISCNFARGTMNITEVRRNAEFTYARSCEPVPNSSPMLTNERFIIVLRSGAMKPEM